MSMIAPAIITMVPRTITIPANHPQIVSSNPLIGLLKFGEGAKYTDPGKCADSNLEIITMVPRTITIPANHPQIVSSNPLIGLLKFGEGAKYTDPGKCADSNL